MSMMQQDSAGFLKFVGYPTSRFSEGKRVTVARCTGLSTDFGYIEVRNPRSGAEIYVHLDRDEIDSVIEALTAVRDAIPAVCKECGQVKPS